MSVAAAAFALAACVGASIPRDIYTPDLAGPVSQIEQVPGGPNERVHVGDRVIDFSRDDPRPLGGDRIAEGDLLIYGRMDTSAWFVPVAQPETGPLADCYVISDAIAFDDGDGVIIAYEAGAGVRLPKADAFITPADLEDNGSYPDWVDTFCLDARGQILGASK